MEGLFSLLFFAIFFYVMMRFGCGKHMIHGHHSSDKSKANDEINHLDPVCGMQVKPEEGYGKMHQGHLVRFCSKSCLEKFEAHPERYPLKEVKS